MTVINPISKQQDEELLQYLLEKHAMGMIQSFKAPVDFVFSPTELERYLSLFMHLYAFKTILLPRLQQIAPELNWRVSDTGHIHIRYYVRK